MNTEHLYSGLKPLKTRLHSGLYQLLWAKNENVRGKYWGFFDNIPCWILLNCTITLGMLMLKKALFTNLLLKIRKLLKFIGGEQCCGNCDIYIYQPF